MRNRLTRRQFVAGASTTLATVGLAGCLGDDDGDVPDVSFAFELGDSTVTVTHNGGERLDEDNTGAVQILREGEEETFLTGWDLPIEEGDSTSAQGRFESGQTIIVRWLTPDQEEFADVDTFDVE